MKPFNLEAALQGEPVQLRNGCKAIVYYRVPDTFTYESGNNVSYPLKGLIFDNKGNLDDSYCSWSDDGSYDFDGVCKHDIVGMWEEPTPTVTLTLPRPFKPKLKEQYFTIVAKDKYSPLFVEETANLGTPIDSDSIKNGNCFRKEKDAQAWIDAMKDAVYE